MYYIYHLGLSIYHTSNKTSTNVFFQVSFSTYTCFISNSFIKVFMSKILEISMDRSERTLKSKTTNKRAFCCKTKHIWLKK